MTLDIGRKAALMALLVVLAWGPRHGVGQTVAKDTLRVQKTSDFALDGKGTAAPWSKADGVPIAQRATTERMTRNPAPAPAPHRRKPPATLRTRAKVLYSETGLYFLFQCEDRALQATLQADYKELWWEDVVEIFLWPEEDAPLYFEYQLSPLGHVRMTRHQEGGASKVVRYEGDRQVIHRTSVQDGKKEPGASITQWTAEIFIAYEWLQPAPDVPPKPGTRWRTNLYRFDYDTGDRTRWEWQLVEGGNHTLEKFGTLLFE